MNLTDTTVEALEATGREWVVWDDKLKGFGVRVLPSGKKSFVLQYRTAGGRRGRVRKVTIGTFGSPWTAAGARKEAKGLLALVEHGADPAADKRKIREELSVAELVDLYFQEGCATKKPSSLVTDRSRARRHISPLLGRLRVSEVSRAHVERFIRDVSEGRTALTEKTEALRGKSIVRGGRGTATRTVGLLGGIFSFAVERGLRPDNPVHGVRRFRDNKGDRFLSSTEWARLGEALSTAEAEGANPKAIAIIRLLALSGMRKSEAASLRWREVDFERGCLLLSDSKTGAKVVTVGGPALHLLASQPRQDGSEWVFPGERGGTHFRGVERVWRNLRASAGLPDLRLHDLRHSFASHGVGAGAGLPVIGALLGHRDVKTTGRYAHLADDPVRRAADRISTSVAEALAPRAAKR